MTRSATFRDFVQAAHPHRVLEPLDATAPTDLRIVSPTVIIEVVGAREALDALVRVRRVALDAPVAAVRVAVSDLPSEPPRLRPTWRRVTVGVGVLALACGAVLAARTGSSVVSSAATVTVAALAPVLAVTLVASWYRARREPVERRRYFERRRSIAVIAVPSPDEPSATSLATSVRHELDTARAGNGRFDVSVIDPPV